MRAPNADRNAEVVAMFTGESWVPLSVGAEKFGISKQRVFQLLRAAGAVRTPRPPTEKPPRRPRVAFRGPCVDCGTVNHPAGYTRQLCSSSCYVRWLYRTSEKHRVAQQSASLAWRKANPERWRELRRRAQRAYRLRQKAKRQQEQQP